MMMDKLPIISATPESGNASSQTKRQSASTGQEPFGAVLAKQVAPETETKKTTKPVDVEDQSAHAVLNKDETTELVEMIVQHADTKQSLGFVDAQSLAMQATQDSLNGVTDGEVSLVSDDALDKGVSDVTVSIQAPLASVQVAANRSQSVESSTKAMVTKHEPAQEIDAQKLHVSTEPRLQSGAEKPTVDTDRFATSAYQTKQAMTLQASAQQAQPDAITAMTQQTAQLSSLQQSQAIASMAPVPGSSNMIQAYPGKTGWSEAISQKIVWMVGATEQSATLTLNPKDLGPLQVVIQVNNEKADATFISENPEVRKALEDGMTQLRQSMSQNGIELGQANVNSNKQHEAFQQASHGRFMQPQHHADGGDAQSQTELPARPQQIRVSNGLVDTFA